ncbi:MAG TPA: DUF5663 domain-containing protein [Candidatus Saccharimonadales bacterium]|nr:DUF5663 domain-containing protein [Candidatus Saccharimonadales bacterium]
MALPSLEEILEKDIFELLGVEGASDDRKKALLDQMTQTVELRVVNRVATMLSENDAEKFQDIAETGDSQKLVDFLVDKEIDLPQIVSEEATKHRVEVVELVKLAEEKD